MVWHESASLRVALGNNAEMLFDKTWKCNCTGLFVKNDAVIHHLPDRRCLLCGQLVDIKFHDITNTDALAISQIPFDKYPPELIIALWGGEYWLGNLKKNCEIKSGPHPPAHKERGTPFYWIYLDGFGPLEFLLRRR